MDRNTETVVSTLRDDLGRLSAKDLARKTWTRISDDEVTTLSTSFAYFWVFAIPPLLILTVMIAAILNRATSVQVVEHLRSLIQDRAPADTREMLLKLVDNAVAKVGGGIASFGATATALLALWSGSSAVSILIKGFNRAYDVKESRSFLRLKLTTLALTLALVFSVNMAFVLLVFGKRLGGWLADRFGLGSAFDAAWTIGRWPIAIIGIMLLLTLLYWKGPNVEQPFRWITLGSLAATILWLIVVAGMGIYLSLADPGSAYGVLGSVIVLLVFLHFTGIVFFLGAEINAVLYRAAREATNPAPHLGTQPRPALADG